jgi:DNA-binding XRE family transcriptional regulator
MGKLQTINTNGAEEMVILPRTEYDRLIGALEDMEDIACAKDFEAAKARGEIEYISWEMSKRLRRGDESRISIWREHRGLTQKALAEKVAMPAAQLSEIEKGKKSGSIATLRKLSIALGVLVDDLLPIEN